MVAPVKGGPRSAPQATTSKPANTSSQPTGDVGAQRAAQKTIMDGVRNKPEGKLTAEDRKSFATALVKDKLLENQGFLGFFSKSTNEGLAKKLEGDVASFLQKNPNASLKDIEAHVADRVKSQMFSAVVGQKGVDMAIANMQKRLQEIRDNFEK
ncbi:hypothetical protein [Myxococcus stipitatus]|uniref:hypothetical protein n=1 Tax=Myxococcus stipitatus TaxID=83455 RepID=UPI0030D60EB5